MTKKILAVDDEKHIVRLVQINLEKAGYQVITAGNGREAIAAVRAEKPDLVVMDVMMPVMDGLEALQTLKNDSATAHVPVIMLTAKAQDSDVFRGWQSGADLYLTKPFVPQELLTFVKRIFDAHEQSQREDASFEVRAERAPESVEMLQNNPEAEDKSARIAAPNQVGAYEITDDDLANFDLLTSKNGQSGDQR